MKKHLFTTFCTSYYGIEIVDPKRVSVSAMKFWRKSVNLAAMKILSLPRESVSQYLIAEGIFNADSIWSFRSMIFWKHVSLNSHAPEPLRTTGSEITTNLLQQFPSIGNISTASRCKIRDAVLLAWGTKKGLYE